MVLLIEASLICDAQSFCNQSNMLVGKIESGGIVRDKNNMMVGKFASDGDVMNKNNMLVGKIEKNGSIKDKKNMTIGRVKSDGTVRDIKKMQKSRARLIKRNAKKNGFYLYQVSDFKFVNPVSEDQQD